MSKIILAKLVEKLCKLLGSQRVLSGESELLVYETDAYPLDKEKPDIAVFPETTEEVAQIVQLCNEYQVPFVPRGAGTSLSGGAIATGGGVMLVMTRMNQILEINLRDRYAVVEPGLVNLNLTKALSGSGFHYAPDPSSQSACTIGGNVGMNAGGPHTLKYGVTTNHVLGLEAVMADGSLVQFGGLTGDEVGLDLIRTLVGSEGTLAIITKIWVRLTSNPHGHKTMLAIFDSVDDATQLISAIIGTGIVPAALELMDHGIIVALEKAFQFGFPLDAQAILIIEIDGLEAGLESLKDRIINLCKENGSREVRLAKDEVERADIWKARKKAFGAIGLLSPSCCTHDGVVPRTKVSEMFRRLDEISKKHNVPIVNVCHAGDGNIHPNLLFDERDPEQVRRVLDAGDEILRVCIELGGSITGEHGIGIEKIKLMDTMFTKQDIEVMGKLKNAFNPDGRLSPNKMLPTAGGCGMEQLKPSSHAAF